MSTPSVPPGDSPDNDPAEGERRRDDAVDRLLEYRPALVRRLQRRFVAILQAGPASVDPLRHAEPIPHGIDARVVGGAVLILAERFGLIEKVGHEKSCRAPAHKRELKRWKLRDPDAAEAWLAGHPELVDGRPHGPRQLELPFEN